MSGMGGNWGLGDVDDFAPCPHCGRHYGAESLKMHVPMCEARNGAAGLPSSAFTTGKAGATAAAVGRCKLDP